MGTGFAEPNILKANNIKFKKGFKIDDFLMFMKFVDYIEEKILAEEETTIFHLCTIIYEKEYSDRLEKNKGGF